MCVCVCVCVCACVRACVWCAYVWCNDHELQYETTDTIVTLTVVKLMYNCPSTCTQTKERDSTGLSYMISNVTLLETLHKLSLRIQRTPSKVMFISTVPLINMYMLLSRNSCFHFPSCVPCTCDPLWFSDGNHCSDMALAKGNKMCSSFWQGNMSSVQLWSYL